MAKLRAEFGSLSLLGTGLLCAFGALSPSTADAAGPKTGVVAGSTSNAAGVLTAGPDGAEYVLPSLARLTLAPGAQVRVFPKPQQLQLAPGAKTSTYSFALLSGKVEITVPAKPRSAVLGSIGKISAVIGAGQATVLSRGDQAIVAASSGDVRTLLADHWQTIAPGSLARFKDERGGTPEPAMAAPGLNTGPRLWFSPGDPVAITGIKLTKVAAADHYELRLHYADGSGEQLRRVNGLQQLEPFTPVPPGSYALEARSVDADGIAGRWSKPGSVRVLGVTVPPGGYVANGDIFVGKGQEVHFSNTDGLEMTYEGAGRYVPASQAVSLYRGETTLVSFRVPGSLDPTTVRLRPRGLYAQLELGPRRAVWPKDPVRIQVELKNREGGIPDFIELKTEVKLGIEPIDVAFTREGNRLFATVPPPGDGKPGPWVIRVEVKDQFGALLGRDFLEIAPAPAAPAAKASSARIASK
jgi:hypothetical protein